MWVLHMTRFKYASGERVFRVGNYVFLLVLPGLIDGASHRRILFRIIFPLSIPMITTLELFQAVAHWNDWFMGTFLIKGVLIGSAKG